jgi:hypothetical protein
VKLSCIAYYLVLAICVGGGSPLQAQTVFRPEGFGQFTSPSLNKPPASNVITPTPATVQPQPINLDPKIISLPQLLRPMAIPRNIVAAPAPALPQAVANNPTTEVVAEQKLDGIWAPQPATNWLAMQRQPVTSLFDEPPASVGLGTSTPTDEPVVDWRVVTPIDVPAAFVPLSTPQPKQPANFWNNPPSTVGKMPKYQWK